MDLPYSLAVYSDVLAAANAAWWPLPAVLWALLAAALGGGGWAAGRRGARPARLAWALLAAVWAWIALRHHGAVMARLDFLAPAYAALWGLQAVAMAAVGALAGAAPWAPAGRAGWIGVAVVALGLVVYPPVAVLAAGIGWTALPVAGMAPHATALATAGVIAWVRGWGAAVLAVGPALWAGAAGLQAYALGFPAGYLVPAGIAAALGVRWLRRPG